jgi:hypothetical protein
MVEIIVRFESLAEVEEAQDTPVRGTVTPLGGPDMPAIRFEGWLQLLGLLESINSGTELGAELPRPLPNHRPDRSPQV